MKQKRTQSVIWWIGMGSAAITAFIGAATVAGASLPWWVGAASVGLAAILAFCNGNNPTDKNNY